MAILHILKHAFVWQHREKHEINRSCCWALNQTDYYLCYISVEKWLHYKKRLANIFYCIFLSEAGAVKSLKSRSEKESNLTDITSLKPQQPKLLRIPCVLKQRETVEAASDEELQCTIFTYRAVPYYSDYNYKQCRNWVDSVTGKAFATDACIYFHVIKI